MFGTNLHSKRAPPLSAVSASFEPNFCRPEGSGKAGELDGRWQVGLSFTDLKNSVWRLSLAGIAGASEWRHAAQARAAVARQRLACATACTARCSRTLVRFRLSAMLSAAPPTPRRTPVRPSLPLLPGHPPPRRAAMAPARPRKSSVPCGLRRPSHARSL
jgi:hypothetical protein